MNNSIWLPNSSGSEADRQMWYKTSTRIDQKRPHQRFMGSSEQDLFLSKKQAVEPFKRSSGNAVLECSLWHAGSHFQSESQIPSLCNPKPVRNLNVSDDNSISPDTASKNEGNKDPGNQFGRISENCFPKFVGSTFIYQEKNETMSATFQRTGNSMFPGPTYNTAVGNAILMEPAYSKKDKTFVSVGNSSNERCGNFKLNNQYYNMINNNKLSIDQTVNRRNYNINALREQYEKENGNFSSICPTHNRVWKNLFTLDSFYCKEKQAFMSPCPNKGKSHIAFHGQQDPTVASLGALYCKDDSMVEHSGKGKETAISSGGFQNNVEERDRSGRLIGSHNVLLNQSSGQPLGPLGQKDSMNQLTANAVVASSSREDGGALKNKDRRTKKGLSDDFPTNVKSLLSTGILDGVPVKYVSWSREKTLRAVVKSTGYLCSCQDCKLSKTISAYEFERHAGCKTKHPNNHIHFENGKTIYAVVQELRSTPRELLFDVIQNVTGSVVNQQNFNTWKASCANASHARREK